MNITHEHISQHRPEPEEEVDTSEKILEVLASRGKIQSTHFRFDKRYSSYYHCKKKKTKEGRIYHIKICLLIVKLLITQFVYSELKIS